MARHVRYTKSKKVRGDKLKPGDWVDSLDHCGARKIKSIDRDNPSSPLRYVRFYHGGGESVRKDVKYDVVNPNSIVEEERYVVIVTTSLI